MKIRIKFLLTIIVTGMLFFSWKFSQPTKIIDTHQDGNCSHVLVKNFPITDYRKMKWWKDNKSILLTKYNIPLPNEQGNFTIVVWDIGNGYKEMPNTDQDSDLFCFDDMKTKNNCIEKKLVLQISLFDNDKNRFDTGGASYLQSGTDDAIKQK